LVTGTTLPAGEDESIRIFEVYFPHFYDIKHINLVAQNILWLQETAEGLNVARLGRGHQAGSDALLTLMTFFTLMERY
jgi:CCR4-NOT transcription complex subunit 7/8